MIPEDIRRFVLTSIPSVPYLEALLIFHRAPSAELAGADLARMLYIEEPRALELAEALCGAGAVAKIGPAGATRYRYGPRDEVLATLVDRLAKVYDTEMIGVTHLIHDAVAKSAHRFADAFKLRKER